MDIKQFYEEVVTFNDYIEFRIMNINTGKMFSEWAGNINDVTSIYSKYDKLPYNIYYGINTRKQKERKEVFVDFRQLFYFDIEHGSNKPEFSNESYRKELLETAHYLSHSLEKKYGIKPIAVICSGRGLHLYFKSFPVSVKDYNQKFKLWFKQEQRDLEKKKPYEHIKFADSVFDAGRIASAPYSHHNKYAERPPRSVLHINPQNVCDLQNILDNFKMFIPKKKHKVVIKDGKSRKYNEKNIFTAPEYKIFEQRIPEMKGYNIHSKLRVALILLMDKYNVQNREEVAQRIVQLGYWYESMVPIDNPDYVYSESILNNWCLDNWELCLQKGITIPYPFKKNKSYKFIEKDDDVNYEAYELKTPWDVFYYVKNFNNSTFVELGGDRTAFYTKAMRDNVMKNIKSADLISWIKANKFLDKIKVIK